MIWLIGYRWKHGNVWSRVVLIGPSPFYVLCFHYNLMIYGENIEDLASNWCLIAPSRLNLWYLMDINRTGDLFGAHNAGEIPVTIPNTEVKPSSADYTATAGN